MRITQDEADALGRKIGAAMAKAAPKPIAPTRKEREIQSAILAYLRLVPGVVAWRSNVGAVKTGDRFVRFGFPGLSDIIGWKRNDWACAAEHPHAVFLAIEVKTDKTYPTAAQQHFLELVHAAGGIAIVARNVGDVQRVLQP